ncbi:MAG: hypothetical protein UY63_C0010G0002 [Parcubacteria group bacterium GW2011_GWA2_51_10]|nr:MAG: hypothetical protein UY63_C0010G0002 [Parcubacteria group bacterium GW2011_GWA2_51_10]
MIFASIIFFLSLFAIVGLFALKLWEERRERILYPDFRDTADSRALLLKGQLIRGREQLARLPPAALHLARFSIHIAALKTAEFARYLERQAYKLADLVSHKHRFERRDTNSDFLKKIQQHAMRSSDRNEARENGANGKSVSPEQKKNPKTNINE